MGSVIVIPADLLQPVTEEKVSKSLPLVKAQALVGGPVEMAEVRYKNSGAAGDGAQMLFDEEGRIKRKPRNVRATKIYIDSDPRRIHVVGGLVGDVVVLLGEARWR